MLKSERFQVRLTPDEAKSLDEVAQALGLNLSDTVRYCVRKEYRALVASRERKAGKRRSAG